MSGIGPAVLEKPDKVLKNSSSPLTALNNNKKYDSALDFCCLRHAHVEKHRTSIWAGHAILAAPKKQNRLNINGL